MPQFNSITGVVAAFPEEWYPILDDPEEFLNGAIYAQLVRAINFKENQLAPNTNKPYQLISVLPNDNALGLITDYGTYKFPINYAHYILKETITRVTAYLNDNNSTSPSISGIDSNGDRWSFAFNSRNNLNILINKGYTPESLAINNRVNWYEIITLLRTCIDDLTKKYAPQWANDYYGYLKYTSFVSYPYVNCAYAQTESKYTYTDTSGKRTFKYFNATDKFSGDITFNNCPEIIPYEEVYPLDINGNRIRNKVRTDIFGDYATRGVMCGAANYNYQYYAHEYSPYEERMVPPTPAGISYRSETANEETGCNAKAYYSSPFNNNYVYMVETGFNRLGGLREEYNYKFEIYDSRGKKLTNYTMIAPVSIGIETVRYYPSNLDATKGTISIQEFNTTGVIVGPNSPPIQYIRDILLTDDNITGKTPWRDSPPVYPSYSYANPDYGCLIYVVGNCYINGVLANSLTFSGGVMTKTPVDICGAGDGATSTLPLVQFSLDFLKRVYVYKIAGQL